jgi:hypothetical protein
VRYANAKRSFARSALVTIRAGTLPSQKEFIVHEDMLFQSEFFRRALQGEWKEADTRIINLPEDDAVDVNLYLQYIYTKSLQAKVAHKPAIDHLWEQVTPAYEETSRIYVFAEKVQDTPTKNDMVRELFRITKKRSECGSWILPTTASIQIIYEGTTDGSLARKLLVDLFSNPSKSTLSTRFQEHVPQEFSRDLLISWATDRINQDPSPGNVAKTQGAEAYLETCG